VKKALLYFGIALLFSLTSKAVAASDESSENLEEKEFNVSEMIMHHVKDAHEWHLWGPEHGGTTIFLPVILKTDDGIKTFSSSHFYHGDLIHDGKNRYLKGTGLAEGFGMFHEKIYELDSHGKLHFENGHVHGNVKPIDFSITKNVTSLIIGSFLVFIIMFSCARFYKNHGAVAPKGIAKFMEPIIIFIQDDIAKANINKKKYKKFVPYLLTIFFFIWINNLLGLIPIFPGSANLTGNISITLFLATLTLILTLVNGNKNYWSHIFSPPGVPKALLPIMIPIEIVGIFTKPFALMIRLFANITAGHIVILALISLIFINKHVAWGALSVPMALFISVLELLVAALQAYLFALLSALFIGAAVEEAHH
tara:strand:- start:12 stop:1112 length:1101 start_codon:yes stop_codon:yes gene_type:complete